MQVALIKWVSYYLGRLDPAQLGSFVYLFIYFQCRGCKNTTPPVSGCSAWLEFCDVASPLCGVQ